MTESLVQDCGFQDRRIAVFVTFVGELRTAEALQNEIRNEYASISADELQRVSEGFL
jgi:hypothetical protein